MEKIAINQLRHNPKLSKQDFFNILTKEMFYNHLIPTNKRKALKRFAYIWNAIHEGLYTL